MKRIFFAILILTVLLCTPAFADNTIKVLMMKSPYDTLPSHKARSVDEVSGKVLIKGSTYSGDLDILKDEQGLYVVKNLPFEKYIEGVVMSETGHGWEIEALKAQAVISRTYASFYKDLNFLSPYHITSSIVHQLYEGENSDPFITYAVKTTQGEILTYENRPVKTFFHMTCAGKTEMPEEIWDKPYPYISSVDCKGEDSPYSSWKRKFSLSRISSAIGISNIKEIAISSYTATGRVKTLQAKAEEEGSLRLKEIKASELRKKLGYKKLPSTMFTIKIQNNEAIFSGHGNGHAVGLSQWGALDLAKQGKNYREILEHYYPDMVLKHTADLKHQDLAARH